MTVFSDQLLLRFTDTAFVEDLLSNKLKPATGGSTAADAAALPRHADHEPQNEGDRDTEQYVLGKVLQPFHSSPVQPRGVDLGERSPDQLVQAIRSAARPERKPYAH
jgi:hypothetical protein